MTPIIEFTQIGSLCNTVHSRYKGHVYKGAGADPGGGGVLGVRIPLNKEGKNVVVRPKKPI